MVIFKYLHYRYFASVATCGDVATTCPPLFFIIARNLMMGIPGKDKSAIQSKLLFKFYNDGFISTSNSEQEEQTNRENMSLTAVYHKFT